MLASYSRARYDDEYQEALQVTSWWTEENRAKALLLLYALTLISLGVRCLLPHAWDIGWYGREIGGWSMYGSEVKSVKVTAHSEGKKLRAKGFWHARFVSSATSRLSVKLVDEYAKWLHKKNKLPADAPVTVKVTYRIDRGPKKTVRGSYP